MVWAPGVFLWKKVSKFLILSRGFCFTQLQIYFLCSATPANHRYQHFKSSLWRWAQASFPHPGQCTFVTFNLMGGWLCRWRNSCYLVLSRFLAQKKPTPQISCSKGAQVTSVYVSLEGRRSWPLLDHRWRPHKLHENPQSRNLSRARWLSR